MQKDKRNKRTIEKRQWLYGMLIPLGLLIVFGIGIGCGLARRDLAQILPAEETAAGETVWETVAESIPEEEEIVYDPPEYDFKTDEITVELDGLDREYTIAFVNDLHMITDKEAGDVLEENLPTVRERYENLSVTPEGIHGEELWPEIVKFLNYHDFDAVIFGGDMLDYCSHSNMKALTVGFEKLKYPRERLLYLRSDHDYGGWYGGSTFTDNDGFAAQAALWDGDEGEGCIDFGAFRIVGINKSYVNLSDGKLKFLMQQTGDGVPVILATHVPFYSETDTSLEELSMAVRNRIYYWNPENSGYCPDANTQQFIDSMYAPASNVVQIVAAHMHAAWDGVVANDLREHIFAPAFQGNIGIIHVVDKSNTSQKNTKGKMIQEGDNQYETKENH